MNVRKSSLMVPILLCLAGTAGAQTGDPSQPPLPAAIEDLQQPGIVQPPRVAPPSAPAAGADYRLGPGDQISVSVLQAPELNASVRVSDRGAISLPLLGALPAGGLTVADLEASIEDALGQKYIKDPEVTVQVTDIRSHPVSVVGAVQRPGVLQVTGPTTLLDVLSMSGGLTQEAGDAVMIVRGGSGGEAAQPIEVPLKALMQSRDPRLNAAIYPGDLVNIQAADIVYVVGAVNKPGAYAMRGNDRLTVLRALALGEGLLPVAAQGSAVVVRLGPGGERQEIPVDLGGLLKGKTPDVALEAHDVLFVPTSGGKVAARTALDAVVRILTFRPY